MAATKAKGKKPKGRTKPAKKRVGRPTLYRPEYAEQAGKVCLLGATNEDLAAFFTVATSTVELWLTTHPEFSGSVKEGRELADANVASRLYARAMGYEHDAVKIITVADGANQGSHVEEVPYIEKYPPDTAAAIFWLKNRQRAKWRDKQDVEHSGEIRLADILDASHA